MSSSYDVWKKARHEAWAGRRFHDQHLVVAFIAIRQWAGIDPPNNRKGKEIKRVF